MGSGIGWSLSPTSTGGRGGQVWDGGRSRGGGELAFKHVLDEDAALGDLLVDGELLIIGCG